MVLTSWFINELDPTGSYTNVKVEASCHTTIFRFRFWKLFLSWPQFVPKCQ